jgi:SPP1 family predicted phage head-tail adaptor
MTNPGWLNRRLVLEAPIEAPDGAGGVTRGYATVTTLWAQVVPVTARDEVVAAAVGATVTHRVTIRMRDDVTTRHRLREGARTYQVVALRDASGQGRFLEISAQERIA